jgi:hypothetical protein
VIGLCVRTVNAESKKTSKGKQDAKEN